MKRSNASPTFHSHNFKARKIKSKHQSNLNKNRNLAEMGNSTSSFTITYQHNKAGRSLIKAPRASSHGTRKSGSISKNECNRRKLTRCQSEKFDPRRSEASMILQFITEVKQLERGEFMLQQYLENQCQQQLGGKMATPDESDFSGPLNFPIKTISFPTHTAAEVISAGSSKSRRHMLKPVLGIFRSKTL